MSVLKIRDENGNVTEIPFFKGDNYVLTDMDKQEIASIVAEMEFGSVNAVLDEILASQEAYIGGESV